MASKRKQNQVVAILSNTKSEWIEFLGEEYFLDLINRNGVVGSKKNAAQVSAMWLLNSENMVLARHVFEYSDDAPYEISVAVSPTTKQVLEAAGFSENEIAAAEDPVERIKRKAKARLFPANMSANEPADNNGFPKSQPWVEPKETIDL